jgi:hypothetical protein
MSEPRVSPAIAADNKRLAWIQSQWRLFQEEEKVERVTGEIMERFLASLILVNVRRPDVYTVWSGCIRRAVEEEVQLPLTSQVQLVIKRWASAHAREKAGGQLYEPTQAVAISQENLNILIGHLWFKQWTNLSFKQSAVIAYICAHTGARANEVVNLFIEDMEWREDDGFKFLRLPLRSSKGNAFKTRREALVLPTPPESEASFQHWMKVIINGRKAGKIFRKTSSSKLRDHFKIAAKALGWSVSPSAHSLRSHFVVEALRAGASESDIVAVCRWKDEAMLNTYRLRQIECTKQGPAFKIFDIKNKTGRQISIPIQPARKKVATVSKEPPVVVDLTEDKEERKPVLSLKKGEGAQTILSLPKKFVSVGCQTEAVQPPSQEPPTKPTLSPQAYEAWRSYLMTREAQLNSRPRKRRR